MRFPTRAARVIALAAAAAAIAAVPLSAADPPSTSVTITVVGHGTVTSDPAGITCTSNCTNPFPGAAKVKLLAAPDAGWRFGGWTGPEGCNSQTCELDTTADRSVTATFVETVAVTVTTAGDGTVVSAPAGVDCGATCTARFDKGSTVTLTAAPASGAHFSGWSGACTGTATTCELKADADATASATFTSVVAVVHAGSGSGAVASTPPGIDCGATCSAEFAPTTEVTLKATPASGSTFAGWSGPCSGTGDCTFTPARGTTVTAAFAPPPSTYPLSVLVAGTGTGKVTSEPAGIDCGSTCSAPFAVDASVTLTAEPATGSSFVGWSGACTATAGTCTVKMDGAKSVAAQFAPRSYTLGVVSTGTGKGTVTSKPDGISCGASCSFPFAFGTSVTLQATPESGSAFAGWSGACTGTSTTCTVVIDAIKLVGVQWNGAEQPSIKVERTGVGSGRVTSSPAGIDCGSTCTGSFASGTSVTLTATPATGSAFSGWGGACSGSATTCAVSASGAKSVTASFVPMFSVSVALAGTGSGTVVSSPAGISCGSSCSASFTSSATVTLTATAAAGSLFTGWSGSCTGTTASCSVSGGASVTATFARAGRLAVTRTGSGSGTVTSAPAGISCGATCTSALSGSVTLTATPDAGSAFAGWSGQCSGSATTCSLTVTGDAAVGAEFTTTAKVAGTAPTTQKKVQLTTRVLSVRARATKAGADLVVRVWVSTAAKTTVALVRPPKSIVSRAKQLKAGATDVALPLPRRLARGAASVKVTALASDGRKATTTKKLTLR